MSASSEQSTSTPTSHEGTPTTVAHLNRKAGYETAYSRQLPLFDEDILSQLSTTDSGCRIDTLRVHNIDRIQDIDPNMEEYPNEFKRVRVAVLEESVMRDNHMFNVDYKVQYNRWVTDDQVVLFDNVRSSLSKNTDAQAFYQAGPRPTIPWAASEVRAAIVTCGGLCPGLNNVVQEIFCSLYYNYGVDTVYGIRSGYRGFWQGDFQPWMRLTPELVKNIHETGGTILGASRGGFDLARIVNSLESYGINQVYIVGGDGTHRGAQEIHMECRRRNLKVAVACVPKTIDNDIGVIDRSFGFNTSVAEARKAIGSVVLESQCTPNGIGIVKLMGRHAGYIAAHATLACRQVDVCLIPEVPFHLHGKNGLLTHLQRVLQYQKSAVIVVAEGAGLDLMADAKERDESGNIKMQDIGHYLSTTIDRFFKSQKVGVSVKYVDPAYMIRSVPADAEDAVYCLFLASHAVHGAMAGFSGFSTGLVSGRTVYLPISLICKASPSYLNPRGSTWDRILSMTHQPNWGHPLFCEIKTEQDKAIEEEMKSIDDDNVLISDDVHTHLLPKL